MANQLIAASSTVATLKIDHRFNFPKNGRSSGVP
jgi:hypothetical protein